MKELNVPEQDFEKQWLIRRADALRKTGLPIGFIDPRAIKE